VHGPSEPVVGKMRVLQLGLTLPKQDRWTTPDDQISPTRNHVPVTLVDVRLEPGASMEQSIPLSHHGFAYVLEGTVRLGEKQTSVGIGQVAWLDRPSTSEGQGALRIASVGTVPARVLLYTGERQNVPIAQHGPSSATRASTSCARTSGTGADPIDASDARG